MLLLYVLGTMYIIFSVVGGHILYVAFFSCLIAKGVLVSGLDAGVDSFNTFALGNTAGKT